MKLPGLPSSNVNTSETPLDNMQLLLQRKAELTKHKAKYTLTERDGSLLVTHATELHFADGQVIVEAGHDVSSVYRVKSGAVQIIRNGHPCCVLSQGYFIGDALLLYDKNTYRMNVSLIASGPVVLLQLDLTFVQRLFSLDSLAMKFYRLLATKSAAIFHQLVNSLHASALLSSSLDSLNDSGLSSSTSSLSDTSSDTSEVTPPPPPAPTTIVPIPSPRTGSVCAGNSSAKRKSKRLSRNLSTDAYKVYPLLGSKHGVQNCHVEPKKIKIVTRSFGFSHKISIDFAKLNSITKIGESAVTIIHQERKVNTIFFKNYHDLEEFMYLVSSLTTPSTAQTGPQISLQPISTPPAQDEDSEEEDPQVTKGEEHFRQVQVRIELKKGDKVFEEGDLYQRVYTLINGSLAVYQKGTFLHYLTDGHVFGVDTIMCLRPCPVTIEVASDTATLLIITAHKMNELIDSDVAVALKLFKRSAQIIDAQIRKTLHLEQQLQSTPSSSSLSSVLSSSSLGYSQRMSQELQQIPPLQLQPSAVTAG